jgi:hypothetical protein
MNRTRWRLAVACLAVVGAAIAAAGGGAGNRTADITFAADPGPLSVTYEENIAYTSTAKNTGASQFTQVEFRQKAPVATIGSETKSATLVSSNCGAVMQGDEAVCILGRLDSQATVTVTLVWQVPKMSSQTGCTNCLTTSGTWVIKEGKPTNANEVFQTGVVNASLLGGEGTQEKLKAGSFEIAACADAFGPASLRTNRTVNKDDPLSTAFCLPAVTGIGNSTAITELAGDPKHSEVCIAALGLNCSSGSPAPANFAPQVVTFVFRVFQGPNGLPNNYVFQVTHNGVLLTAATCQQSQECLVGVTFDKPSSTYTIVATSPTNGSWGW